MRCFAGFACFPQKARVSDDARSPFARTSLPRRSILNVPDAALL
jgi:hypothetical protein